MSDKENRFFSTENQGESAATDQPEVEGHRAFMANENSDERLVKGTEQPEVEGHRYYATENPDDRAHAVDQPEVEGHRLHATEDGSDDERAFSRSH